jgi:MFS family permease
MFILTTQSGMLIIANAAGLLKTAGSQIAFFADNAWLIVAYGGLVNALGRVGTGFYSDKIGRANTYTMNCMLSAVCLLLVPYAMKTQNILLLFIVIGNAYWQYGGGLALMPLFTGDFYGSKNLGANYGLVFIGWGLGFFMAKLGGMIKDLTGSLDYAFYISAGLLVVGAMLAQVVKRPVYDGEDTGIANQKFEEVKNTNAIIIVTGVAGFFTGGFIAFLLRPAIFLGGQLPFEIVIFRGITLTGMDQMLVPVAQQSFNMMFAGAIVGMLAGIFTGYFIAKHTDA